MRHFHTFVTLTLPATLPVPTYPIFIDDAEVYVDIPDEDVSGGDVSESNA